MNYIRSYENHINKCLSKFNEVENFAVQLKKTLENKQNELSELRELRKFSINDIQKKLNEYLEKTGKNFSSKLLEN
jgi:tRNA uridine 5-carbamoylmethylation protein Kti12